MPTVKNFEQPTYAMLNGKDDTEYGHIVKLMYTHENGAVQVLDELTNGSGGGGYTVSSNAIVPISDETYHYLYDCLCEADEAALNELEAIQKSILSMN